VTALAVLTARNMTAERRGPEPITVPQQLTVQNTNPRMTRPKNLLLRISRFSSGCSHRLIVGGLMLKRRNDGVEISPFGRVNCGRNVSGRIRS